MMLLKIIALFPVIIGAFAVQVNWLSSSRDGVVIRASAQDDRINQCLQGGLQLRFKFETRICYRRNFWFDGCGTERIEVHSVQFDPIKEEYNVVADVHHDVDPPKGKTVKTAQDALNLATSLNQLAVAELDGASDLAPDRKGAYLGVRVLSECRGESGGILAIIPTLLSFGLIDSSISDSGWVGFNLEHL